MALRRGIYIVPTSEWYIERTVWLIAGFVLLASTGLALFAHPLFVLGVIAAGLLSITVALTGFCVVGNVLHRLGFESRLGERGPTRPAFYFMRTDSWYLERRIYAAVGVNISVASILSLVHSPWWLAFTAFVGGAMVWFAATGFCIMANGLYWLGAEPRLAPLAEPPVPAPSDLRVPAFLGAITLVIVVAAVGLAKGSPQVKAPSGGSTDTVAVEGVIDVISPGTHSLSLKTTDGTTQLFRWLEKVFVHGTKTDDELSGLERGMTVVVHYSRKGQTDIVEEIDRLDGEGLEITEGQVASIDRARGEIKIRFDDNRTETLKLSNRVVRNVGRNTAANTRVVVYYTNTKGVKEVHYFKKKT